MKHVTSIERFLMEKMRQEGQQDMLLKLLKARFKTLPDEVEKQVRQMDQNALYQVVERMLTAQTLAEVGLGDGASAGA